MTLQESLQTNLKGYRQMDAQSTVYVPSSNESLEPVLNPMLRSPIPPINATPDSLRQFYQAGKIPQFRLLPPNQNGNIIVNNTSTVSTTTTNVAPAPAQSPTLNTAVTTPVLNTNGQFQGILQMSSAFTVQKVAVSSIARVRLYSTQSAQQNDSGRDTGTVVPAQTDHQIILDVVLGDATKLLWVLSPVASGANGDSPQTSNVYITVDNLGVSSVPITASLVYKAN